MFSKDEISLRICKTWNACVFVIESPWGRSAKRLRAQRRVFLAAPLHKGLNIPRLMYLKNEHIVLSNGVGGFSKWLI